MSDHNCPWEVTIKEHQRQLAGNGGKGLIREMEEMRGEMKHMNENYDTLSRSYGIIAKSLDKIDVKERVHVEIKKRRNELIKRLATIMVIIGGVLGVVKMILNHI